MAMPKWNKRNWFDKLATFGFREDTPDDEARYKARGKAAYERGKVEQGEVASFEMLHAIPSGRGVAAELRGLYRRQDLLQKMVGQSQPDTMKKSRKKPTRSKR